MGWLFMVGIPILLYILLKLKGTSKNLVSTSAVLYFGDILTKTNSERNVWANFHDGVDLRGPLLAVALTC